MTPVIFDLDGTLVDSAPDIRAAVNAMLADEGVGPLALPTIISFVGNGLPKLVERTIAHLGLNPEDHPRLTATTHDYYTTMPSQHSRLYPGVLPALTSLKEQGHSLALCTNKPYTPAVKVLEEMELAPFFSAVVGGDSLATRKPNPEMLHHVAAQIGAERFVYVGDSNVDAETAQRADAPFLLFTEGYRKSPVSTLPHTASFDNFDQLVSLVAQFD